MTIGPRESTPSSDWAGLIGRTTAARSRPGRVRAVGLALQNVTLGIALFNPDKAADTAAGYVGGNDLSSFFALKATATSASLVGMGSVLTVNLQDILLEVNQVNNSANVGGAELYGPINLPRASRLPGQPGRVRGGYRHGNAKRLPRLCRRHPFASVAEATIQISQFVTVIGSSPSSLGRSRR